MLNSSFITLHLTLNYLNQKTKPIITMKALRLLFFSGILALSSCTKDLDYSGVYKGECSWSVPYPNGFTLSGNTDVEIRIMLDNFGYYFKAECEPIFLSSGACTGDCSLPKTYLNRNGNGVLRHQLDDDYQIVWKVNIDNNGDLELKKTTFICPDAGFGEMTSEGILHYQ